MKSPFGRALVRLTLVAYIAASVLGTGLHSLFDCEHHDAHCHGAHYSCVLDAPGSRIVIESSDHAHDAEHGCPICQFQGLAQLHVTVDWQLHAAAVTELPLFVPEQPALAADLPPYSPRGPPEPVVILA